MIAERSGGEGDSNGCNGISSGRGFSSEGICKGAGNNMSDALENDGMKVSVTRAKGHSGPPDREVRRREIPHFALHHRRKFHAAVLRGVRNISEAPENPPMKFLLERYIWPIFRRLTERYRAELT